jgi:hypothetical protein
MTMKLWTLDNIWDWPFTHSVWNISLYSYVNSYKHEWGETYRCIMQIYQVILSTSSGGIRRTIWSTYSGGHYKKIHMGQIFTWSLNKNHTEHIFRRSLQKIHTRHNFTRSSNKNLMKQIFRRSLYKSHTENIYRRSLYNNCMVHILRSLYRNCTTSSVNMQCNVNDIWVCTDI